jgi:hydrogenase/urease accessory protein HupE
MIWWMAHADAHSFRPWVVDLVEVDHGSWRIHDTLDPPAELRWPTDCAVQTPFLHCETPWPLSVDGIAGGEVVLRLQPQDAEQTVVLLTPDSPEYVGPNHGGSVAPTYVGLGIEHILLGFDHLAFVFGLMLLVRSPRTLITTVTSFTVAHSITLAAAALALVSLPSPPVEASIALSIVLLAREVVLDDDRSLLRRSPWIAGFGFGLLHGFGFAGALGDIGLPARQLPLALLSFNVGVELGQLAFVGVLVGIATAVPTVWRARTAFGYAVGIVAMWWTFERVGEMCFS